MRPTQINWTFRFAFLCLLLSLGGALIVPRSRAQQPGTAPAAKPATTGRGKPSRRSTTSNVTVTPSSNKQILKIVSEIDARNIENTIRKLVSFGTRNTLSEQDNPNRGIGPLAIGSTASLLKPRSNPAAG